jgi:hypothetical protein
VGGTKNAIVQGKKSVLRGKYTTSSHIAAAEVMNHEQSSRGSCLPLHTFFRDPQLTRDSSATAGIFIKTDKADEKT